MRASQPAHPPLTTILLLGTSLGLIAGLLIGAGLGGLSAPLPPAVPAPEVQVIVTLPPWPTPERTPTVTPYPTRAPSPTATSWPVYDPRYATPGRLYEVPAPPPPTPTPYPACHLALPPGTRCVAVTASATVTAEPLGSRR